MTRALAYLYYATALVMMCYDEWVPMTIALAGAIAIDTLETIRERNENKNG